jgi:hypothetical protein
VANDTDNDLKSGVWQIAEALKLMITKLHWTSCEIDPSLLDKEGKQERLVLIETITALLAEHGPRDLRAWIRCSDCGRAAVKRVSNPTIH